MDDRLILLDGRELELFATNKEINVLAEQERAKHVFLNNINILFDKAEKILSDSRMFLALVPDAGCLAYMGSSMFDRPCIGVFLLWWKSCNKAHIKENGGEYWIYNITGSPISGINRCGMVSAEGALNNISISPFHEVWRSFISINTRYQGLSEKYEHYSLDEVLKIINSY